jgi:hypothetical protein
MNKKTAEASRQIQGQEFRVGEIAFLHAHCVLKDMLPSYGKRKR